MSERIKSDDLDLTYKSKKKFGLDPYIVFDEVKNEIRMEIPLDVLMDPEKNKKLGEIE